MGINLSIFENTSERKGKRKSVDIMFSVLKGI